SSLEGGGRWRDTRVKTALGDAVGSAVRLRTRHLTHTLPMRVISVTVVAWVAAASFAGCRASAVAAPPTGFFVNGDVRLSYRLTKPEGKGPFPAVVIGHGSGEATKEM